MGRSRRSRRLSGDFSLGGEQAEADPLLQLAFYDSADYTAIQSKLDPHCFVVGRTGGGKSAALKRLEETHHEHVVRINPEDLSLPYITDLGAIRQLDAMEVHLDPFFIALWKHVLLVELIRHRYKIDSLQAKQNFLQMLRERITRDTAKKAALDYLDEFEGRFWCETDERVRDITERFEQRIEADAKANLGVKSLGIGLSGGSETTVSSEVRSEQAERYQRIVNETQLARLNKMMTVLDEDILDSPQLHTYVVIDDLDRDWVDERVANDLIRCLFRTVLELKRIQNLKVLVALRTNIFEQLQFGERSGAQEEKFRSLVLEMRWTKNDLTQMLDDRARAAGDLWHAPAITSIADLLPVTTKARGKAIDYILDRTLMRPRDAIAFVNESLTLSGGKARLSWQDIQTAEGPYSRKRLLALRDEWKMSYPGIDRVLDLFKDAALPLTREEFRRRLDEAMLLVIDDKFPGTRWMTEMSRPMWSAAMEVAEWPALYQRLAKFLFAIGLIGFAQSSGAVVYSYEDEGFADTLENLESVEAVFVHPAFHLALNVRRKQAVRGRSAESSLRMTGRPPKS
jgi:hypothetical protein